jgi:hypothetical protein
VFRVRLFLPEVHAAAMAPTPPPKVRRGYEGRVARSWWSTTKRPTANCWCTLLAPLGFELRTAASGHDALDLLAAGLQPDAILMDLAMPGIDGWETIRRCAAWSTATRRIAVVSANAFDKALDNDAGIRPRTSS